MKLLQLLLALTFSCFTASTVQAQVNPGRIPASLIKKSVEAELGTKNSVTWNQVILPDEAKASLKGKLKIKNNIPDTIHVGVIKNDNNIQYLIPDIAPSRSEEFSYVLFFDESKSITGVDVLQYRENYGNEIDYPFFRKQFKGKQDPNKVIFGRTIQNISGATISVRSITYSIHDLLLILNQISLP